MTQNLSNMNLPFNVEYSSFPNSQLSCQNNLNVIPNGPILPTRPVFPSALPPSLSQYPSTMQTNFMDVKRQANICNLRTSTLIVDSGLDNNTLLKIKNLPELESISSKNGYYRLIIDDTGRVYRHKLSVSKNNGFAQNLVNNNIDDIRDYGILDDSDNF